MEKFEPPHKFHSLPRPLPKRDLSLAVPDVRAKEQKAQDLRGVDAKTAGAKVAVTYTFENVDGFAGTTWCYVTGSIPKTAAEFESVILAVKTRGHKHVVPLAMFELVG